MTSHEQFVLAQFDPKAEAYLASPVHAIGPDLANAVTHIRRLAPGQLSVLDVGCGAGHLSFALSPLATTIEALDPSINMLNVVASTAQQKGLNNIKTIQGNVESMPVDNQNYDVVATRYSAHHWRNLDVALSGMIRALKSNGHLLVIDIQTWEDPLIDTHFQTIEILRDKSHVRNRSDSEWRRHFDQHGFSVVHHETHPVPTEFKSWIARMDTPALNADMIRSFQDGCPAEVKGALNIQPDGSFVMRVGTWIAKRT